MDRIKLCPEPSMTKEAKELTPAGRSHTKVGNYIFPKETARVQAKVHTKHPGIGEEKKASAVTDEAMDKLAAALALGSTLAEEDLLGLRKKAMETAARLMAKSSMEQAPQNPGLPTGGGTPNGPLGGAGAPTPRPPTGQQDSSGIPKISTERAPAGPALPASPLNPRVPPPPPMPGPPPETQQGQPKVAATKFATIMENTRQRMLRALVKVSRA